MHFSSTTSNCVDLIASSSPSSQNYRLLLKIAWNQNETFSRFPLEIKTGKPTGRRYLNSPKALQIASVVGTVII
jgi:hypothetical protein